jgi:hypothetical protein
VVGTVSDLQRQHPSVHTASVVARKLSYLVWLHCEYVLAAGLSLSLSLSLSRMCVLSRVLANSSETVIVAYGGRLFFFFLCFSCALRRKCFGTQMSSTTY